MFRKIIIFILALFFATPVTPADDSSIIPVIWLFAKNKALNSVDISQKFNDVYRLYQYNGEGINGNAVKTYYLSFDKIYEFNGQGINGNAVKTYYPSFDKIYEFNGQGISGNAVKTYYISTLY